MKNILNIVSYVVWGFMFFLISCHGKNPTSNKESGNAEQTLPRTVRPYTPGTRIAWDYRTLKLIDPDPSAYPRMIRLDNGNLLVAYEDAGVKVRTSEDNGENWQQEIMVQPNQDGIVAANPELLQLENGDILLAYNERPYNNPTAHFTVRVMISKDSGLNWSDLSTVYKGGLEGGRGVWEPVMIQLPDGEIQLYFANENPYPNTGEQEISMSRSADGGTTWSEAEAISFRAGHRDGMPVPIQLNNGDLVITIEDSGIDPIERRLKPAVIRSTSGGNWDNAPVDGKSADRWRALDPGWHLPKGAKGGAPYIVQFPSGETVLSFQTQLKYIDGEPQVLDEPTRNMLFGIGSPEARNFHSLSAPFEVEHGEVAVWGSAFIKDAETVTAVTTTNAYNNGKHNQVYAIDGHRIPEMEAIRSTVKVDGTLSEKSWSAGTKNFLGACSQANADFFSLWDEEHFYVGFNVRDQKVMNNSSRPMQDDGVVLYLAPDSLSYDAPVAGTFKLVVESDGTKMLYNGDTESRSWKPMETGGIEIATSQTDEGYSVEASIPWKLIGGQPALGEGMGINLGLVNDDGRNVHYEVLSGNRADVPSTWSKITLAE